MYAHEATESDEDCEVYFLKPVNEYNIVDKIKEANKELFASAEDLEQSNSGAETNNENGLANRKVTFAPNLEDYEPTAIAAANADSLSESGDELVAEMEAKLKLKRAEFQCSTIAEEADSTEDIGEVAPVNEEKATEATVAVEQATGEQQAAAEEQIVAEEPVILDDQDAQVADQLDVDVIEEEIGEELIISDMEDESAQFSSATHRRIVKQTTFDLDLEQDNKSLTNLLPASDDDEEITDDEHYFNADNAQKSSTDSTVEATTTVDNNDADEEEDEEDDLSIIVASYIPNDFSFASQDSDSMLHSKVQEKSPTEKPKRGNFFAGKRFSFRRKLKPTSNAPAPEPKMSYKTCCEYRNSTLEKLPKYTGYLSEYGLSREQLMRREQQFVRKQRYMLQQTLKTSEDELRKMQDNERAFTTWLKNKMRYPINKTRNMFDVKLRRGSAVASACSSAAQTHRCGLGFYRYKWMNG